MILGLLGDSSVADEDVGMMTSAKSITGMPGLFNEQEIVLTIHAANMNSDLWIFKRTPDHSQRQHTVDKASQHTET